ncbi:unnamed protein product [Alopecurus aequalis]
MAWEEIVQRHAEVDKSVAKGVEVMRLVAAVTEADLASGDQVPTREFVALTALAEATALRLLDTAASAAESAEQTASSFVGRPDAETLVEALRRHAASLEGLRTQAAEFAVATRRMASLPVVEEEHESSETRPLRRKRRALGAGRRRIRTRESRKRKRNGKYFSPERST